MSSDRSRQGQPGEERGGPASEEPTSGSGTRLPDYVPFGWPDRFGRGEETTPEGTERVGSYGDEVAPAVRGDDVVPEGIATLAILVGVVLFLVPEPITSLVGALLVAGGAAVVLGEAFRGGK